MSRILYGTALLFALVLPALAADDKDKPDSKEVKEAKEKLISAGTIIGKLTRVDGTQKYLTVEVTTKTQVPNPSAAQQLVNLQRQLADASQRRDARRIADIQRQMAQQQTNTIKDHKQKVELQAGDDVKVRTMRLPTEFDDKGNPRKHTAKELKELKGPDPKLPGYAADFDSLKQDQWVEARLVKPKSAPKPKPKDKDRDKDALGDDKPRASVIVILGEAPR